MDVAAALDELQASLGMDEVALQCFSSAKLEVAWVERHEGGLRVSDNGTTYVGFLDDDCIPTPPEQTVRAVCARFSVDVVMRDEDVLELECIVPSGGDVREAVRAVMAAADALGSASEASRAAGGRWDEDVLAEGRRHELPFADEA